MARRFVTILGVVSLHGFMACAMWADVQVPAIFGDHMVLQQEAVLRVWGTADPGEMVAVSVGGESAGATADLLGKWQVKLSPLGNGVGPTTMTVAGKNTLTFTDVLIGEVWLCSGQSNMEFSLSSAHNAATELPRAGDPQLRLFHVRHMQSPQRESAVVGSWELSTPDTAKGFSAVAYFFGRELRRSLNRPVGLIQSTWSGTPITAWTSAAGLKDPPRPGSVVVDQATRVANYKKALAEFPAKTAAYQAALETWNRTVVPRHEVALKQWAQAAKAAKARGQAPPPKPEPSLPMPKPPDDPAGGYWLNSHLFNGMIAPLMPFAIKGALWYQGEQDAGQGVHYRKLLEWMIADWRDQWGQGDFPFLFVQLASYESGRVPWAYIRESQLKTLALPNTAMASAIDLGDYHYLNNIHPLDKLDVGLRLALAAKHVAYGQTLVYSGPIYDSSKSEGSSIRVHFLHTGGGLVIGRPPWIDPTAAPWPADKLAGFEVAGADGKYLPADARIDGNSVIVQSAQIGLPVDVRFGWSNVVKTNLYNKEGLPASPFRTDTQPPPVNK